MPPPAVSKSRPIRFVLAGCGAAMLVGLGLTLAWRLGGESGISPSPGATTRRDTSVPAERLQGLSPPPAPAAAPSVSQETANRGTFGIGSALAAISRLGDEAERRRRFDLVAEQLLREDDPPSALAKAAQVDVVELADGLRLALLRAWARRAPSAAAQYARGIPPDDRPEAFAEIFGAWGTAAPLDALRWLASYPESEEKEWATGKLFGAWSASESANAAGAALRLPATASRDLALSEVAGAWAEREPLAALNWVAGAAGASSIPGEMGDLLRQQIVSVWAAHAPAEAADWAYTQARAGRDPGALQAAVSAWSETDPASASAFLARLPPGGDWQKTAAFNVGLIWGRNDAAGAQAWVESVQGPERDSAAAGLAQTLVETKPPDAMALALSLREKNAREAAVERIAKSWRALAPASYRQWWKGAAMEAALKNRLPHP